MIRALVDFALKSRWLILGGVIVLTAWGVIAFRNLPIEAYPDVANNYVQIITQWQGRSAEEIERQVTVPIGARLSEVVGSKRIVADPTTYPPGPNSAAADFRSRRSTLSASSSFAVQWGARYRSSSWP